MKKELKNKVEKRDLVEENLAKIGLTTDQAIIYKTLLDLGASKAFRLSFQSGIKRALTYKILSQLQELGLVEERTSMEEKVATFFPTHPSNLEKLINKKKESFSVAESAFNEVVQGLVSSYNLANKKPNIRFWEGLEGVKKVYDDIVLEGKDMLLFRSAFDREQEGLNDLIQENIKRQVRKGIHTRAITPLLDPPSKEMTVANDPKNLVTRKFIKIEDFNLPAQIVVYGDKVAIISYKENLVTTIIENKDIRDSVAILFELIWSKAIAPEEIFG